METYKIWWLGGIGLFVFIGIIISLSNLSGYKYYQEQYYNHLPSVQEPYEQKPEAIKHYEDMRDESVKKTEEINLAERGVETTENVTDTFIGPFMVNPNISFIANTLAWFMLLAPISVFGVFDSLFRAMGLYRRSGSVGGIIFMMGLAMMFSLAGIVCPFYGLFESIFTVSSIAGP